MDNFEVIPVPAHRKLQELGSRIVPKLTYGATLLAVIYLWSVTVLPPKIANSGEPVQAKSKPGGMRPAGSIAQLQP